MVKRKNSYTENGYRRQYSYIKWTNCYENASGFILHTYQRINIHYRDANRDLTRNFECGQRFT